jgi:hypothetical protein
VQEGLRQADETFAPHQPAQAAAARREHDEIGAEIELQDLDPTEHAVFGGGPRG